MWRAAIIFLAVYVCLMFIKRYRPLIAWTGVLVALVLGALDPAEVFKGINWNVIGIFIGSIMMAEAFIYSRVPEMVSDQLINRSSSIGAALLLIIAFASVISIIMENVVCVLIAAPIALQLTRKANVSPVPVIVGLAISSNLQGMAILIGDTPSMILAARMKMNFLDFFIYTSDSYPGWKVGIFWLVQLGAVTGFVVLRYFTRGGKQKPARIPVTPVLSWLPVWLIIIAIVALSFAALIDPGFIWFGGSVCMLFGVAGLIWCMRRKVSSKSEIIRALDWGTAVFLAAVFVLVFMLERRGAIEALVGQLGGLRGANPFLIFSAVVWISAFVSAFIDNVPYITAMLPVVIGFSQGLAMPPEILAFGVLFGSCMGGNITPIGASANIAAVGILKREGTPVSFLSFVKIGLPFTLASTVVAYLALWVFYR